MSKSKIAPDIEDKMLYHSQVLADLHSVFNPHIGQIPVGKALFYNFIKRLFIECGRKWGKTELLIYVLYRVSLMKPNSWSYYILPLQNMILDVLWENNRLPGFLPNNLMKKYGITVDNQEYRISFGNGSFIKCDGSDNHQKGRGYSATGIIVYDEYKDHNPKFHDAFEPNLAITDSPIMFIGTPPDESEPSYERWCLMADEIKLDPNGFYINQPSSTNPHLSKEFLIKKRAELIRKGELWKWEKEYEAKRVKANSRTIFPMLDRDIHIRPYKDIMTEIMNNHSDWDFHVSIDPGSAKCFAILFGAVHRYNKKVYLLDEIYESDFGMNSVGLIMVKFKEKLNEIMPEIDRWSAVYDHAAAWFWNEYQHNYYDEDKFNLHINKCEKDMNNKENRLSFIKDMLLGGFLGATDRCIKWFWEMSKYSTDENGRIPKVNDHLIDDTRYMFNDMRLTILPGNKPKSEVERMPERRKITIEEDLDDIRGSDIYGDIDSDLYDN